MDEWCSINRSSSPVSQQPSPFHFLHLPSPHLHGGGGHYYLTIMNRQWNRRIDWACVRREGRERRINPSDWVTRTYCSRQQQQQQQQQHHHHYYIYILHKQLKYTHTRAWSSYAFLDCIFVSVWAEGNYNSSSKSSGNEKNETTAQHVRVAFFVYFV